MIGRQLVLDVHRELIVDNFAGGGGASTGIEMGLGRCVDIAINHDPVALAMHAENHPQTRHFCEDVWAVDPVAVCAGRPVGLAWFSPDCKHFSKAKGGKPRSKKVRGLAWLAVKWAALVRPRVIMLENVEEFQTWGPLLADGKPCPRRKGKTFLSFIGRLRKEGYAVEWREIRGYSLGAPTSRKRLFIIARCDGRAIVWPEATHGKPDEPEVKARRRKKWRTAAECIDWSLPCPSIFERKKPLADATLRRIARGIMKFVVNAKKPFFVPGGAGMVAPVVTECANASSPRCWSADEPLRTQCAEVKGGHFAMAAAHLTKFRTGSSGADLQEPLPTVTAGPAVNPAGNSHAMGVVSAFLAKHFTEKGAQVQGSDLGEPMGTVTAVDHHSVVAAHLVQTGYGERDGQEPRAIDIEKPLGTVVGSGKHAVVAAHISKLRGDNIGQPMEAPLQTVTASGNHFAEVRAFLVKYYGTGDAASVDAPMPTITCKDRMGLVTIEGEDWAITDIGMRMLKPHELYKAQGFPEGYLHSSVVLNGSRKALAQDAQVRMVGNSVCPPVAAALAAANVPEMIVGRAAA